MTYLEEDEYLLFELEIDNNKVSLQNFYNFVDARCEEERIDAYYDKFEDFPIKVVFELEDCETQCTFCFQFDVVQVAQATGCTGSEADFDGGRYVK